MVLLGPIVNGIAIIAGTLLGKLLERIPESMKNTVMQAIGLALMLLGVQMGLKSGNFLIVILSLVIGAVAGSGSTLKTNSPVRAIGWSAE